MIVRPRRSVLYMPGANARALEKAKSLPADSLILDLEDAVAPEAKAAARDKVCAAVKGGGYGRRELVIRINALETPWGMDDLRAAAASRPMRSCVPKVSNAGDIVTASKVLDAIAAPDKTRLWAMMETPARILNAREIAALGADKETRLVCFVMGTNDLVKEIARPRPAQSHRRGAVAGDDHRRRPRLRPRRARRRLQRLSRRSEGFREECEHGRTLGIDGKTLIHPSQVVPCNEVFSPPEEEVSWSRKIIAAFDEPENARKGVITSKARWSSGCTPSWRAARWPSPRRSRP